MLLRDSLRLHDEVDIGCSVGNGETMRLRLHAHALHPRHTLHSWHSLHLCLGNTLEWHLAHARMNIWHLHLAAHSVRHRLHLGVRKMALTGYGEVVRSAVDSHVRSSCDVHVRVARLLCRPTRASVLLRIQLRIPSCCLCL